MRVAVSGGRRYRWTREDRAFFDELHEAVVIDEGCEGGADGADAGFRDWCDENMIPVTTFRAAWRRPGRKVYDPSAGPKRNQRMGNYVAQVPSVWVFLPGDRGTADAYMVAVHLRKTHPDLVIIDRRNVRAAPTVPELPVPRRGHFRVEREYIPEPPGGRHHGSDSVGGSFAGDW